MKTILTIWTKPLKTFEYLDGLDYKEIGPNLNILFYLGTIGIVVPNMISDSQNFGDYSWAYLIFGAIFGSFFGVLFIKYVYAFIFKIFGKLLNGNASIEQIRIVLAYMMVPGLINLAIALILIVIALLIKDIEIVGYQNPLTQFVIWIFSIRTLIFGLAKYNRFSYGYALINILLVVGLLQGLLFGIRHLIH